MQNLADGLEARAVCRLCNHEQAKKIQGFFYNNLNHNLHSETGEAGKKNEINIYIYVCA